MSDKIFVNLPVKDLNQSINFFKQLGFTFDPMFTDEKATCMIIGEHIFVMLLKEEFFKTFTKKNISDSKNYTEVLIAIDVPSRDKVDEMVNKAINAGGAIYAKPQDHGWMYSNSFEDPDGHQWEILYIDEKALKQMKQEMEKSEHH